VRGREGRGGEGWEPIPQPLGLLVVLFFFLAYVGVGNLPSVAYVAASACSSAASVRSSWAV
jgi:hypothetical protein